jgi:hypothetical protein
VLGAPALAFLNIRDGGVYVDGTFGAGGYTRAILAAANCKVVGIDRDQRAIALGADLVQAASGRLTLIEDRFANLDRVAREAGFYAVDGVVLDLGVSSMQLDSAERGFSFRFDGPLDMRMGSEGPSAADAARSAIRAAWRAPSSRPARRLRSSRRARSPISSLPWCARARATFIPPRARSRRSASSSMTSSVNWPPRSPPPNAS